MIKLLITIDRQSPRKLQIQIMEKLVELIISGVLKPGMKLPSSRKLSTQLGVSRNTVVFAYQKLVDEGFVTTRQCSGFYVSELDEGGIFDHRRQVMAAGERTGALERQFSEQESAKSFPYPFVNTMVDIDLFPLAAWRDCQRQVMALTEVLNWGRQGPYHTDPELVEEIRSRILPGRGISAAADEIVITCGYRGGLALLAHVARHGGRRILLRGPVDPVARNCLEASGASVLSRQAGGPGAKGADISGTDILCVAPGLPLPSGPGDDGGALAGTLAGTLAKLDRSVTLWECDPRHTYYAGQDLPPPLKSSVEDRDVIYISELSPVALAGQAVGYIVAPRDIAHELRHMQRMLGAIPVPYFQHATALFIAQGYYDGALRKLAQTFARKWHEMSEALSYYLPLYHVERSANLLSFRVQCRPEMNVAELVRQVAKKGILIQSERDYAGVAGDARAESIYLSVNAIPEEKIEEGVRILAETIREQTSGYIETLDRAEGELLDGTTLQDRMSGLNILGINSLGEPYEITLHPDGAMSGIANRGTPEEERDSGFWRVQGDFWVRKWDNWSYGRESASRVVIRGQEIKWFRESGRLLDNAVIFPSRRPDQGVS